MLQSEPFAAVGFDVPYEMAKMTAHRYWCCRCGVRGRCGGRWNEVEWVSFGDALSFRIETFRFSFATGPWALARSLSLRPGLAFPFWLSFTLAFGFPLTLVATIPLSLGVGWRWDQ